MEDTSKCRSFQQGNCKESQGVSQYSFLHPQKALRKWGKRTESGHADPKPQLNQRTKFWVLTALRDRSPTGQQLQAQLNSGRSNQVSVSTVKKRLWAAGLTGRVAARKPLLRCQSKTERLSWAVKHHHWTTKDWKLNSEFQIFGSSHGIFTYAVV